MWMGLDGQWGQHTSYGDQKYHSTRISSAFGTRSTAMGNGEYASTLDMSELWDKLGVKSESTRNRIKSTWNRDSKIKMVGSVTEAHDSKVEALWWSYRKHSG
ncbi:hypothetical protein DY000_02015531 [Brassica cretica]|uniref:Uncharacterized protein n=1 Tax=Brassica cretica TaxID=69181 RepID=A0ABQ7D6C6_BRACR|nr:hypothetical protein DY000_02015531 [Brassica cretica]